MRENGFTIVELVIVLLLIGLLAVYAIAQWPGTVVSVDAQAQQIASDIRYTQALSMNTGQRYRFIRTSSSTYQITNSAGTPILLPFGNTTAILGSGISFGSFTNLPSNLITFDGSGTPYVDTGSPGTALSATASIPLQSSNGNKTITIAPETGRVLVQ